MRAKCLAIVFMGLVLTLAQIPSASAGTPAGGMADQALIKIAADRLNTVFSYLAASTRALGRQYAALDRIMPGVGDTQSGQLQAEKERWLAVRKISGQTAIYKTWPGDLNQPPAAQAAFPAFYSYTGAALSDETVRQFKIFSALVPAFQASFETFGLSWVYLTTVDDAFLVYPFVPLDYGVASDPPRKQVFYTCADFKGRGPGWSRPYLDLAGSGMMITAACPFYAGQKLLGVVSRDITLNQLSAQALKHLAAFPGSVAFIIDGRGMVIGSSDPAGTAELEKVNTAAGQAVLHYRTPAGLKKLGLKKAAASDSKRLNSAGEQVLAQPDDSSGLKRFTLGGDTVLSARIASTGWFAVLVQPNSRK